MLEWLIVGGGIQGTHLSHVLVRRRGVDLGGIAVLDPHDTPLHRWRECTRAIGMKHLRSPGVHHLDLDPFSLHHFGAGRAGRAHPRRRRGHHRRTAHARAGPGRKGEHNRLFRERYGFVRLGLHCREMGFAHPRTGEPLVVKAPLDAAFTSVLAQLGIDPGE